MAKENIIKFEEAVRNNKDLQAKLENATKAYTGDKTDEKAVFDAIIVPIANEEGLPFTFEEAIDLKKESADEEIDLDDMTAVAGGTCGVYKDFDGQGAYAFCLLIGIGSGAGAGVLGASACMVLGLGVGGHLDVLYDK